MTQVSDEELMAFADGVLDEARAREVGALVAADAALAVQVERLRAGTAALQRAFAGQLRLETPERLSALVERTPKNVVALKPRRLSTPVWASVAAAAACLVIGFGVGRLGGGGAGLFEMRDDHALVAAGDLRGALENAVSGSGEGDVRIALTFPQTGAGYCRVFRIDRGERAATAGLACKAHDDWTVVALGEAGRNEHGGIERAAADIPETVLQAAADRQGGDALDARAEAAALGAHWKTR